MKILLVNSPNFGGVEYYRMINPCNVVNELYPEFEFTSVGGINMDYVEIEREKFLDKETGLTKEITHPEPLRIPIDDFLKQFDLVHFCRGIDMYNEPNNAERLNRLGIPFGLDLDDYWFLPKWHILYNDYVKANQDYAIIQAIESAHFVTCTTPILAKSISEFNKNVYIIENGIDDRLECWHPDFETTNKMRFGFYQGTTHYENIRLAAPDINKLLKNDKLMQKAQVVLSGFMAVGNDKPSFYIGYEKLLTNDLSLIKDKKYKEFLYKCINDGNEDWMDQPYWRCWGTQIDNWGYTYNFTDVSLVPMIPNTFNRHKSELKMIEAGFKGKAVIVSDENPYKILANEDNSFLVRGRYSFYKQIKYCIDNPNAVKDKANQLYQDVKERYSLKKLAEKRKQVYEIYKP